MTYKNSILAGLIAREALAALNKSPKSPSWVNKFGVSVMIRYTAGRNIYYSIHHTKIWEHFSIFRVERKGYIKAWNRPTWPRVPPLHQVLACLLYTSDAADE